MSTIDSYPQVVQLDGTELIPAFKNGQQVALPSGLLGENSPLPGTPGLSAYQQWLQAGNTGTVAQFLASLRGPPVTIAIGSVTTAPLGQPGAVTIDPSSTAAKIVFNFVLPVASGGFAIDA